MRVQWQLGTSKKPEKLIKLRKKNNRENQNEKKN